MTKKTQFNMKNPLTIFKKSNKNMTWAKLSGITGISLQGLLHICRADEQGILNGRLKTYLAVKDSIGVDLLEFEE